jgi:hypothetical protein
VVKEAPIETSSDSTTKMIAIQTVTIGISLHVARNVGTIGVVITDYSSMPSPRVALRKNSSTD